MQGYWQSRCVDGRLKEREHCHGLFSIYAFADLGEMLRLKAINYRQRLVSWPEMVERSKLFLLTS